MKTRTIIMAAIAAAATILGFAAQAAGLDLHTLLLQHQDAAIGLSAMGAGSIDLLMKSMDSIEQNINDSRTIQRELSDRVQMLEQRPTTGFGFREGGETKSIGKQVADLFTKNSELFEKTKSLSLQVKAAADPLTTTNARTMASGGVGAIVGGFIGIQNALPTRGVAASAIEYSRLTSEEGAAAVQAAEGDAKAAVRPVHTLITQNAITVAGHTKMSKQALSDSRELENAVNLTLARSVNSALDAVLASGSGAVFAGGFNALATAVTSAVYTELPDAVSEAVATMQTAGFNPDTVVMSPAEWLAIVVAKSGGDGQYFAPQAYLGQVPLIMRGLKVVLSPSIAAGKAMVLDSTHTELLIVDSFSVEIGYTNDDFTRNLAVLLGELRVLPVFRTVGAARLVTPL